jgi:hypothetical protein
VKVFFSVLGFELTTYTLSHLASPFFVIGFFKMGSQELFSRLDSSCDLPDLCLVWITGTNQGFCFYLVFKFFS